ncbi:hypothetical protein P154DRAFT_529656 [Amniculicola lignicola CBS 123094]|uniref:Aminoglycoside phosphotransferase domain-containing protein n=1 Tax=Amniculicola lignicola CBS 123094 TaxID=1392246 RepID=A0A6A5WY69_9PLEO|nr:hypothetical protein P154DRAFT_529656 [Amniculicola lignicola CBS 123094]
MATYFGLRNICKEFYRDAWCAPTRRLQKQPPPPPQPKAVKVRKTPSRLRRVMKRLKAKSVDEKTPVSHIEKLSAQSTASSTDLSSLANALTEINDDAAGNTPPRVDSASSPEQNEQWLTRADFETIRNIPDERFKKALAEYLNEYVEYDANQYQFFERFTGGNNHIRIFDVGSGNNPGSYVVKVPGVGTAARWKESDAYMLRTTFYTMRYIFQKTKGRFPIPEVIGYSDTLQNELGAPFVIMRWSPGVDANEIWFDQTEDGDDDITTMDTPSAERMEKRLNLLRTLAQAMAELELLEFKGIGMLSVDEFDEDGIPLVGPVYENKTQDLSPDILDTEEAIEKQEVYNNSYLWWSDRLDLRLPWMEDTTTDFAAISNGVHFVLRTMLDFMPFKKSLGPHDDRETFVLRHDDLNFQNILCDPETGRVTSIIDFDLCQTAPRCVGYAGLPMWLQSDWFPDYRPSQNDDGPQLHHAPSELWKYRKIYSDCMLELTAPGSDGKYTLRSCMYQAVRGALFGSSQSGDLFDVAPKVLQQIPALACLYNDMDEFLITLGRGWQPGQDLVRAGLKKMLID